MKSGFLWINCLALGVVVLASGCTGQSIRPTAASIAIPKAPAPIPASIGITNVEQKLSGGFPDLVHDFKKYVDESNLFQAVYYPVRPNDRVDGTISLSVKTKAKIDPWAIPKSFFTGLGYFIPEPVIYYHDRYQAECTMEVVKGERHVKSYTADGTIIASHKLLYYPDQLRDDGTEAAGKLLWANLIEALANDRAFLEQELAANSVREQFLPIPAQSLLLRTGGE